MFIFTEDRDLCKDLIIVCCHATYIGHGGILDESQWFLQPFSRSNNSTGKPGEHSTFITHLLAGINAAEANSEAMLMMSGGQTTDHKRSEAAGYARVCESLPRFENVRRRCALEEVATDSFQNLLFSILRFRQLAARYPRHITVITHAFKEDRFLALHAPAIRWPAHSIRVQGINPPFTREELMETQAWERSRAYVLFEKDPYGVGRLLASKREARNYTLLPDDDPFWVDCEPEVKSLSRWEGGASGQDPFPERLPWDIEE